MKTVVTYAQILDIANHEPRIFVSNQQGARYQVRQDWAEEILRMARLWARQCDAEAKMSKLTRSKLKAIRSSVKP